MRGLGFKIVGGPLRLDVGLVIAYHYICMFGDNLRLLPWFSYAVMMRPALCSVICVVVTAVNNNYIACRAGTMAPILRILK